MIIKAVFVSSVLLLSAFAFTGCNTTISGSDDVAEYNADPLTVSVAPDVSPQVLQEAMVDTFQERQWTVVSSSPNEVVGTLDHRGFEAKVTMKREGNVVKLYSDSTQLEDFKTGKPVPAVPLGWLENLQKDLPERIANLQR
ncbi:hypothetical protein [Ruficoccus sp. ZRK36]|uniref:hypothetical protein n=1 Tax=Ruficoccus sp. ZRK36 TaxID=2866311 RepID=UPI001C72FC78|nr:hypothetical protein [Ruficoccus sp. ZRK36]QYY36234.1 hypothetical protein K0V07_01925 [Ruficoccus sp. ZRK36]